MTETTQRGRSVGRAGVLTRRPRPVLLVLAIAVVLVGGAVGGFLYGLSLTHSDLASARQQILELRPENQSLKNSIVIQQTRIVDLQSQLTSTQTALHAIMPSENTYNIAPNQSIIVAGSHLVIGLVGSPSNDQVNININGKPQMVTTGDVIRVAVDPSTSCQVRIQSFDLFKVIVNASCTAVKQIQ